MVGLLYELFLAVWTTAILSQNIVGLITHEMPAMRADVIMLELFAQILTLLGQLRRVYVSLDEEGQRCDDGQAIKQQIPFVSASTGYTEGNGHHSNESCD